MKVFSLNSQRDDINSFSNIGTPSRERKTILQQHDELFSKFRKDLTSATTTLESKLIKQARVFKSDAKTRSPIAKELVRQKNASQFSELDLIMKIQTLAERVKQEQSSLELRDTSSRLTSQKTLKNQDLPRQTLRIKQKFEQVRKPFEIKQDLIKRNIERKIQNYEQIIPRKFKENQISGYQKIIPKEQPNFMKRLENTKRN